MSTRIVASLLVLLGAALAGCQSPATQNGAPGPGSPQVQPNTGNAVEASVERPGFTVEEEDGRLWVLRAGEAKSDKHITLIGAGPNGETIRALSRATAIEYLGTVPGFTVKADDDGRLWVFRAGSETGMPDKHITKVGVGPRRTTVKAVDRETLDAYLAALR